MDSRNVTKVEKALLFNTLGCLVKGLENRYTIVDLRNECCVTGKIVKVDGYMNIEMEDVILNDMRQNEKHLESFFVSARNIINIHIPKKTDPIMLLHQQLEKMTRKVEKGKRTFKTARAVRNNIKTLEEAYKK
ncbi:hypothetical protein ABEB36_002299 [Hypothenemus hampei]|uniref:Sm domain-containing protein n=1 Tax=Hypothenemus hampei TaxID=57062 RepID=A0ABD1F8D2_HYPHA